MPSLPASGDVLIPMVIERLGSSMWITGSGRGSSRSVSVSPIVISGMPAIAMISPGPTLSAATRSSSSVMNSSEIFAFSVVPSARHQATVSPLCRCPFTMRHSATRPRYGDESRLVTSACNGASGSNSGAGMRSISRSSSGLRVAPSGRPAPSAGRSSDALPSRDTQYTIGKSS